MSLTSPGDLSARLTISAVPTPQFGWQPHFIVPRSAPGPWIRSVASEKADAAESGNQSRNGSSTPVCCFTSCARCDSVYRWRWRVSSSMSSSRPVSETG